MLVRKRHYTRSNNCELSMKEEKKKEKKKIPVYQIHRSTYVDTHARLVLDFIVLPAALGIDGTIFASIDRIRILNNLCMEMHSLTLIILTTNCPVVCAVKKQHCGDREKTVWTIGFFPLKARSAWNIFDVFRTSSSILDNERNLICFKSNFDNYHTELEKKISSEDK